MRRLLIALLSSLAAAAPFGTAIASAARTTVHAATVTRKLVGRTAYAGQWGSVNINVTLQTSGSGTHKRLRYTDLGGSYTYHTARSQFIMSQALPMLRQEFLSAQSMNIQMITGATYTSEAFLQSLQSALLRKGA
jgi:uncharacterized protein with FMN-binding domain